MRKRKKWPVFTIVFLAFLFIDQLSKVAARINLDEKKPLALIKGFLSLTLVKNKGVAFGLFKDGSVNLLLLIAAAVVVLIIIYLLIYRPSSMLIRIALGLIAAGSIGNFIDRAYFKQVTDFIDFHIWPVFNVADSSIFTGTALLLINSLFKKPL